MPLLLRKSVLAAKLEATVGTDATPGASDATYNVFNANIEPTPVMEEREGQGGFDRLSQVNGARTCKVTFQTEVQWDGTSTEPAWAEAFLPACGWVKSSQTYSPKSAATGTTTSDPRSLTISHYIDGKLRKATGCVGTFKVTMPAGKRLLFDWEFMGVWAGETDASILTPTYVTDTVYKWTSGVCQWNNVDIYASLATIDAGNVIVMREDPSTSSGYLAGIITDRYPKITIDPEMVLVATQDREGLWTTGTEYALELHAGGVTNSKFQFDAPKAQIIKKTVGERNKLAIDQLEFACNKNGSTADQSLSITFTAAT